MAYKTYNKLLPAEVADIMQVHQIPVDYLTYSSIMIDYNHAAEEGPEQLSEYLETLKKRAAAAAKHLDKMADQSGSQDWMTWPYILEPHERPRQRYDFWTGSYMRVEIPGIDDTNAYKLRFFFNGLQTQEKTVARPGTPYNRLDIPVWMAEQIPADTEAAQEPGFEYHYWCNELDDSWQPVDGAEVIDHDVWEKVTAYEVIGIYIIQKFLLDNGQCYSTMGEIAPLKGFIRRRGPGCIVYG